MTVAAVILSASPEGSLALTAGVPRVRRLVEIAWAGGALPVIVVAGDPDGSVARALASTESHLVAPAPVESGPVGQIVRGVEAAVGEVRDTSAALVWPARMVWVGAETVTSLIEAHGTDPGHLLRPSWEGSPGWPALVPLADLDALRALAPSLMPDDLIDRLADGVPTRVIELGDPGVAFDASTDLRDLPPYLGPDLPASGHVHEWGVEAPDLSEDVPTA
jgi:CTP:molybdopterin cytidylyltransferase MocA